MIKKLPPWTKGIESTLTKNNAKRPEQYSWYARDENGLFIFITEADHKNKNSSIVKLKDGYIQRNIDPITSEINSTSKRHAKEIYIAAKHAFENGTDVRVLLTHNSRYSKEPKNQTSAVLLPWHYKVTEFEGKSIEGGFSYRMEEV